MAEARKKLAIIDGKSVFYRGYYAMSNLSTKDGKPTGGVYGFAVMALEVIKRLDPDYVCVAWDKPKTNIRKRKDLYPEYKAGRKPAPPDFYEQIPLLHELLEAFGWPLYELDDYEADDIMGTLALQAREKGIDTALITSDLDLLQVINGNVHVYALKKGLSNIELFHPESFEAKYGIKVDQFLDLKSLKGDSSDNIPGAPGIGEKTAIELLKKYETVDGVYENIDLIKESVKNKLIAGKDLVYLSKKLAQIWTDAPIQLNLEEVDGSKCDPNNLRDVLQKLEFKTLARQLPEYMHVVDENEQAEDRTVTVPEAIHIRTSEELERLTLPKLDRAVIFALSSGSHGSQPVTLAISPDPKTAIIFDLSSLNTEMVSEKLKDSLEKTKLIGHNIKAAIQILMSIGIKPKNIDHDTQIVTFLLDPLNRNLDLTDIAADQLNIHLPSLDAVEGVGSEPQILGVIWRIYDRQLKALNESEKLKKLSKEVEMPVIPVLAEMEYLGIQLDTGYLGKLADRLKDTISDLEQEIFGYADQEFNISSPAQLSDILFDKLKLPTQGIKKGKTAYSTAANELDKLRGIHPIINLISKYREVTKLMNTYVDPLPKMIDEKMRLHTTYNMVVAQTGRLSSEHPNLQNIPVRTELGREIRTAFVAGPGNVLISADYSQIELRIAALLSGDDDLIDLFNRDVDVHTATAAQVYGREPEDITKNMRRDAKVINFGVMYGLSPHGLSIATGMTRDAAKNFIDKYFEMRPKLVEYINSIRKQAEEQGYVETLFGRRRPTPDVHSSNFAVREAAMRAAINMPFQGTAADIMKLAMIRVDKELAKFDNANMLLQIHDSVLVECPEAIASEVADTIKDTMENVEKLPIKLTVDVEVGKNWGEL